MRTFATPLATLSVLTVLSILGGVPRSFGKLEGTPTELIRVQARSQAADERCPAGSLRLHFGLDLNGNAVLDASEAAHPIKLCRPALQTPWALRPVVLARLSSAPASADCVASGARIAIGNDDDGDGRLSPKEELQVSLYCNTAFRPAAETAERAQTDASAAARPDRDTSDGPQALLRLESDEQLSACPGGGSRVQVGVDSNRNGSLDSEEIDSSQLVCDQTTAPARQVESIASLPADTHIGQTVQLGGAPGLPWRIRQVTGERINTEALLTPKGSAWAATGPQANWTAVAQSADGLQLLAAADGRLLRSDDGGVQWLPVGHSQNLRWSGVAMSRDGRQLVATSRSDALYTSDDAGRSWTRRSIGLGWGLVAASGDGQRLVATRHGWQLLVSSDGGRSWARRSPVADWSGLAMSEDGLTVAAVAANGRFHVSRDGGMTWLVKGATADYTAVAMTADGQRIVTTAKEPHRGLRWSDDWGDSWVEAAAGAASQKGFEAVAISAKGQSIVGALRGGGFWSTNDGGSQWRLDPGPAGVKAIALSSEGLSRVAVGQGSEILRSAAATTPGQQGSLHLGADVAINLRYQGAGIWAALAQRGAFYVQ